MPNTSSPNIVFRTALEGDVAFIFATWLQGLYHGCSWAQEINKDVFFKNYHRVIEGYLGRPDTIVMVACFEDSPDVILGYSVYEAKTLHWIFIKKAWRRFGIAKKLVPAQISSVTHVTKLGKSIKPKEWEYNPFL